MIIQTDADYKLWSNNLNNINIDQIHHQINANNTITQNQEINEHKLNRKAKTETTYPTDQNNNKSTLLCSNKHRITGKHLNQTTIADLH